MSDSLLHPAATTFTRNDTDSTRTGSPIASRFQLKRSGPARAWIRTAAMYGSSEISTSAAPPSRAARHNRVRPVARAPPPPAWTTIANPPERSSASTHSSASPSFRGRASRISPHSTSGITLPTPSTHAARSPRRTASAHAARNTADPPAPAIHTVSRPFGNPPPGRIRSSAGRPVGTCGTVRSGSGTAFGKRASMISRSLAMAVISSSDPAVAAPREGTKPPVAVRSGASGIYRIFTEDQGRSLWGLGAFFVIAGICR